MQNMERIAEAFRELQAVQSEYERHQREGLERHHLAKRWHELEAEIDHLGAGLVQPYSDFH